MSCRGVKVSSSFSLLIVASYGLFNGDYWASWVELSEMVVGELRDVTSFFVVRDIRSGC
jgi:hypothetical protein